MCLGELSNWNNGVIFQLGEFGCLSFSLSLKHSQVLVLNELSALSLLSHPSGTSVILTIVLLMITADYFCYFLILRPSFSSEWVISKFLYFKSPVLSSLWLILWLTLSSAFFISFVELTSSRISVEPSSVISISVLNFSFCSWFGVLILLNYLSLFSCALWVSSKQLFWIIYLLICRSSHLWIWLLENYFEILTLSRFLNSSCFFFFEFCTAFSSCEVASSPPVSTSSLQVRDASHWTCISIYLGHSPPVYGYTCSMLLAPSCGQILKLIWLLSTLQRLQRSAV